MSQTAKGFKYENTLADNLYNATNDTVSAYRLGYSGNGAAPSGDLIITHQFNGRPETAVIEAKRWKCDKGELRYIDHEDILQLVECTNDYTRAYIAASFDHRELVFFEVFATSTQYEYMHATVPNAEVTSIDSGALRIRKPTLNQCNSATSGLSDATVILSELTDVAKEQIPSDAELTAK